MAGLAPAATAPEAEDGPDLNSRAEGVKGPLLRRTQAGV